MNAASNQHLAIAGACTWKKCWGYEKIGNKSWNPSLFFVSQFFLSRFHPREITAKISFGYFSRHRTSDKRKILPLHENPSHDRYFRIQSRISAENIVRDCFDVSFFFLIKSSHCLRENLKISLVLFSTFIFVAKKMEKRTSIYLPIISPL